MNIKIGDEVVKSSFMIHKKGNDYLIIHKKQLEGK